MTEDASAARTVADPGEVDAELGDPLAALAG
jgi:hypothetical protein